MNFKVSWPLVLAILVRFQILFVSAVRQEKGSSVKESSGALERIIDNDQTKEKESILISLLVGDHINEVT
jgi:hypothetical protein